MELKRRAFLGAAALTVGFAGCLSGGGSSNSGTTTTTTEAATSPDTTAATPVSPGTTGTTGSTGTAGTTGSTVRVSSHPTLGEILVGPDGMTLYMFDQDILTAEYS